MAYVTVQNLRKRFDTKDVLKNINLSIQEGEIFGLIGPNGAGKTTLINIMLGLLEADEGDVLYKGKSLHSDEYGIKAKIGYIPQELALIEESTAWANLEYFATLYNLSGKARTEACNEALKLANLEEEKNKKVSKLSGGMKRRLNIACATMHKPDLIILDEPTVGVDPQSRNFIFEHLIHLNKDQACTILYTSHYMEEIEKLCDRVFIIDNGEEIAFGSKEQIRSMVELGKSVVFIFEDILADSLAEELSTITGVERVEINGSMLHLDIRPDNFSLTQTIDILEEKNLNILSVSYEQISLEQVFLALTGKELRG